MTPKMEAMRAFYFAGLVFGVDYDDETIDQSEYEWMLVRTWEKRAVPAELIDDAREALRSTEWWDEPYSDRAARFLAAKYCRSCGGEGWVAEVDVHPYSTGSSYNRYTMACDCTYDARKVEP